MARGVVAGEVIRERAVELYKLGATFKEAAQAMGVGETAVRRWVSEARVPSRPAARRPTSDAEQGRTAIQMIEKKRSLPAIRKMISPLQSVAARKQSVVRALAAGRSIESVAAACGVSLGRAYAIGKEAGIFPRPRATVVK